MVKIRLQRIGRRNDPHFRLIVTDAKRGPKSGKFIEILGSYSAKIGEVKIDKERAAYWLSVGAQPSETVHNFLVDQGVVKAKKKNALPKKTAPVKEVEKTEEVAEKTEVAQTKSEEAPAKGEEK
jgi:small subunit ribosomal protein S16